MSDAPTPSVEAGGLFEIVEEDVDGARLRVFKNAPPSLRAIWALSAAHGDADYLVFEGERYSFTRAHAIVSTLAWRLHRDFGVQPGDRVALAMRNFPEWAFSFWAAASIGAVVVPLNSWWTGPELAYGLADSGTRVLVADGERLERLDDLLTGTDVQHVVAARSDRVPADALSFDEMLSQPDGAASLPDVAVSPDDPATIMYTSGTTGKPKGAVGTNRNIGAHVMNALWAATAASALPGGSGAAAAASAPTATLLTFPLFHVGGLHSFLIPYTVAGGKVVLLRRWDAALALDLIEQESITSLAGVPTTMFELLDEAQRQNRDLGSVSGVAAGATLVPPELVRRIDRQFTSRAAPTNGYGLTETSGAAVANTGAAYLAHPDSVGRAISPVMEIRIADPDGFALPPGEVGEIWLRGPTIIRGYHGNEEATAAAITGGWFHTGDAGRLDDEGFLYVVDRLKDVVIRGGENVYAAEVEARLYEHPDVVEAAIVGVPDDRLGEAVAAVVRLRDGATVDGPGLRAHVAAGLAAFKVPSLVQITADPLPRNAAGKVLKRELRETLTLASTKAPVPGR
ncbi:MAG TPA: AMP-binding protein [Acidimicrobiales bacterium]|jgi:long-chain acyl-CoA synthetase